MTRLVRLRRFAARHAPLALRAGVRVVRRRARTASRVRDRTRVAQAEVGFLELLSHGESREAAAATTVRKLIKTGQVSTAMSFADALASQPETATAGHLAAAVVATHRKLPELARSEFDCLPAEVWRPHATGEYLDATYRHDPEQLVALLRELVTQCPADVGPEGWFQVLKYAFVAGERELARRAYVLLVERAREQPEAWSAAETEIAWVRSWLRPDAATTPPVPEGHVSFALLDYRQPGRAKTSQNIGDHIQTLASLGHLVRHQNVRFHGDDDLAAFVATMQGRVRPERRLATSPCDVTLFTADRDASTYQAFPEGTWVFAFGWYMHPLFGLRHDFPLHPNLRPIFVSFHCNKREMLTPVATEYLRRYGPVGCRDWTTVDLLLSIGVPAFFSGCLTTTVDTVFPVLGSSERPAEPATVYVDMPPDSVPVGAPTIRHSYPEVKRRTFVANMREAVALLERYRHTYTKVVTSRLHCYLPVRSLGLEVDFRPKNRADVRLNGLIDIDDATFDAIRTRMLARLETMMSAILAGKPEDEVYRLWSDVCAEDVAGARARHASAGPFLAPSFEVADAVARVRATTLTSGPAVSAQLTDIAIFVGRGDTERLPIMLDSLLARSSRPVCLWLLAERCSRDDYRHLAQAFPEQSINWLECAGPVKDVGLILVPELLSQLDRVTVLPPIAVVQGDITELAERDLGESPLAARSSVGTAASSGFAVFYRAARRLHPNAAAAHDLYRRVHAQHVFDFDAFDTDVLVLDLARMRKDGFSAKVLPYVEQFGLTPAEALILYAGPDRAVLPPEWAHLPTHERVREPQLVHWSGSAKPWSRTYVAKRELWANLAEVRRSAST